MKKLKDNMFNFNKYDIWFLTKPKGETKFNIAKDMLVQDFENNGQRYTIQTIRFCIEAAVLRNYGK